MQVVLVNKPFKNLKKVFHCYNQSSRLTNTIPTVNTIKSNTLHRNNSAFQPKPSKLQTKKMQASC